MDKPLDTADAPGKADSEIGKADSEMVDNREPASIRRHDLVIDADDAMIEEPRDDAFRQ